MSRGEVGRALARVTTERRIREEMRSLRVVHGCNDPNCRTCRAQAMRNIPSRGKRRSF